MPATDLSKDRTSSDPVLLREGVIPDGESNGSARFLWTKRTAQRGRGVVLPLISISAILALWWSATHLFNVPAYQLPSPEAAFSNMVESRGALLIHARHTALAIVLGFLLAIAIGVPLGLLLAFSKAASQMVYPLFVGFQAIPKVAIAPLFLVWLGFGLKTQVAVAASVATFPIVINTTLGLSSMPVALHYLALSMGGGPFRRFAKVRLPYAMPSIFSGLKIGITLSAVGAVVGELIASNTGLGYYLLSASSGHRTGLMFATLFVLAMVSMALFWLVQLLERLTIGTRARRR